ncbi:MAG: sterol desaturase family protein [Rhodomicrobium sp.]
MAREFLKHGSNAALILSAALFFILAAAGLLQLSLLWVLAGAFLFYMTEYTTHRFLFHAHPSRIGLILRLQRRLHYDHHVEPSRLDLLFLPLWYVVPNFIAVSLVAWGFLGDWNGVLSLVLGAMLALLHYEWVHYIAHIPYKPRTGFGRWMKKYHLLHHFKNERFWFGVSNPTMDLLYRTYRAPEDSDRSASTRVLFPEA